MHIGIDVERIGPDCVAIKVCATRPNSDDIFLSFARHYLDQDPTGSAATGPHEVEADVFERLAIADPDAWRLRDLDAPTRAHLVAVARAMTSAVLAFTKAVHPELPGRPIHAAPERPARCD